MKINKTLVLVVLAVLVVGGSNESLAQYYGGGTDRGTITVDKKIKEVTGLGYVDNIDYKQYVFNQGATVDFRIVIENTSGSVLKSIKITDRLPKYLELVYFPGELDKVSNSIGWTLETLGVAETKTYSVRAKIVGMPSDVVSTNLKQTNSVCVTAGQVVECDYARYYVAKVTIPTTGANDMLIKSMAAIISLGVALLVRKQARGY